MMFGLVVAKFQFPCRSPYLQLNVLKGIFGRFPGWREEWPLWDASSLPPSDSGSLEPPSLCCSAWGFTATSGSCFGRWTPDCVSSGWR